MNDELEELKRVIGWEEDNNCHPATCDVCNRTLKEVWPNSSQYNQYCDALTIRFMGGWGEYIDPMEKDPIVMMCKHCADVFVASTTWAKKALADFIGEDNDYD